MADQVNMDNLENVVGGSDIPGQNLHTAVTSFQGGYLALLRQPSNDMSNNVAAQIFPGQMFYVDTGNLAFVPGYTFYYASFNGTRGWVDSRFVALLD